MDARRQELLAKLEEHYRGCGWAVERAVDGTVRAAGPGGVTWIGLAVVDQDLGADEFESRLLELSEERMPRGQRCPLELLPEPNCADGLRGLLARLHLTDRGHVAVYSLAA